MKTMLIFTDFSENAFRAAEYGAFVAGSLQIERIILYSAYQALLVGTDLPNSYIKNSQEIYLETMENLGLLHDRVKTMTDGKIKVDMVAEETTLPGTINNFMKTEGVDIAVMGVSGKAGIEKLLLGSTTSKMIEASDVPVLIVPKETPIGHKFNSIIFTTDLKDATVVPVHQLYKFLDAFPVPVRVVNVESPAKDSRFDINTKEAITDLHKIFAKYNAAFDYLDDRDIVDTVLDYADRYEASMIIMVPKKQGFFASIFNKSISKKLAYHSNIPMLSLPPLMTEKRE
ncbi:universal stress protein [Chitinophaga silvatica]|nr:universal stress protein [Chitinophaga silvatica]